MSGLYDPGHHPGEDVLWDYHRGALAPGMELVVATHARMCPHCRDDLKLFDQIGGAMLETMDGVEMSDSALDLALARIERPEEAPVVSTVKQPAFLDGFDLPDAVRDAAIKGRYWAAPGVWMAPIAAGGKTTDMTFLMFVKAGMAMPEHTHHGIEATLVLKGHFSDKMGEYRVGDLTVWDQEISHSPAIAADEDCLCLVWQNAPIRPKTLLGKLLQPFARI